MIGDCKNYQSVKYLYVTNAKVDIYRRIAVSVSGGSDSDVMIDMFSKCDPNKKVRYVFFNTGLEYEATKNHLDFLEQKYGITIEREKAIKPIPLSCKQFGQPFLSKFVSEMISRLQKHNFQWEDLPYEELLVKYPKCKSAIDWWCNKKGEGSSFNIKRNKLLKEFLIKYPPKFKISNKCCKYAKKDVGANYIKDNNIELNVTGVRKAEGGIRATRYKNCFDRNDDCDNYRPLFFFTDKDKLEYKTYFEITYSDCYEKWGMQRTGCVGCPYGRNLEEELKIVQTYEPKLYSAVCSVFKDSYEYTRQYYHFRNNVA